MPTDGSGNYSLPDGSVAVNGEVIEAATHNTPMNDIAAALSARLMASGARPWTGNQNANGNLITGLAAGANAGESVRFNEWIIQGTVDGPGRLELATVTEAQAATDTERAVTPEGVKAGVLALAASAANFWAGTADKILSAAGVISAGAYVALSDGATIATDCATGRNFSVTIADDRTLGAPTNVKVGQCYTWKITQGTGAPNTLAYHANFSFGDAAEPTLSTSEGDIDLLQFFADSATKFVYLGCRKGI